MYSGSQKNLLLILLLVALVSVTACLEEKKVVPVDSDKPVVGGTYRRAFADAFIVLDPALIKDSNSHEVCRQIYDGLLEFDEKARLQPVIAKDWSISEDKLTYTFNLRDDIRFHDTVAGRPTLNGGRLLDGACCSFILSAACSSRRKTLRRLFSG
jgi:ABC-type transport system substrate-binding protein